MTVSLDLLPRIAEQLDIQRGTSESELAWQARVMYSVFAIMGYASLWDAQDGDETSIVHFSNRIKDTASAYFKVYPELEDSFDLETVRSEIITRYQKSGYVYHSPRRLQPSVHKEASCFGVTFGKGFRPDLIHHVSGLGFYSVGSKKENYEEVKAVFDLSSRPADEVWKETLRDENTPWKPMCESLEIEFLNRSTNFGKGMWTNRPDRSGRVSMFRYEYNYYLYRYELKQLMAQQLDSWRAETMIYTLACGSEIADGRRPRMSYKVDGSIVNLRFWYIYPNDINDFVLLYSWPSAFADKSSMNKFMRTCSKDVFPIIKRLFEDIGFIVEEE